MEGEYSWCSEYKESTIKFKERLVDQRRHYTNPDCVVDEEHSLLMLGDADPCAVEVGMWMAKRADVSEYIKNRR